MKRLSSLLLLAASLTACERAAPPPQALPPVARAGSIDISEPRMRLPPPGRDQTAAYFTLLNTSSVGDKLVAASSPHIRSIELHAHMKGANGMMEMRALTAINIPPNSVVPLSPGGLHLMARGLQPNLKAGESVNIVLEFASGQSARIAVPLVVNPSLDGPSKDKAKAGEHRH